MNNLVNNFKGVWKDESGATAIEYGLLAALISVAIILTVSALGGTLKGVFSAVDSKLAPTIDATS